MGILHECHGMSTEEAMMKIPKIVFIAFDEEDGEIFTDEISFDKRSMESQKAFTRADLVREVVEAAEDLIDSLDKIIHPAFVGYTKIEAARAALAALKAMEG